MRKPAADQFYLMNILTCQPIIETTNCEPQLHVSNSRENPCSLYNVVQHRNLGINSHSPYFRSTEFFLCLARQVLRNHQCGPRPKMFRDHWYTVYTASHIYYILLVKNLPNDPGVAARMGFEPTTFRSKSIES